LKPNAFWCQTAVSVLGAPGYGVPSFPVIEAGTRTKANYAELLALAPKIRSAVGPEKSAELDRALEG
jgi:hypothetical protein